MAQISIDIPDNVVARVLDAFDGAYPGRPGGTSQAAWAKARVAGYIKAVTVGYERQVAAEAAGTAAEAAADSEISAT